MSMIFHVFLMAFFGFFNPVFSLLRTSRRTRAASRSSYCSRNFSTAFRSALINSRSAHDNPLTIVSSWSSTTLWHTARTFPVLSAILHRGTVETTARRRRNGFSDVNHSCTVSSADQSVTPCHTGELSAKRIHHPPIIQTLQHPIQIPRRHMFQSIPVTVHQPIPK